jgi:hypothetical protein
LTVEEVAGCLVRIVLAVLIVPISFVVATPFILIWAFFGRWRYWHNVSDGYSAIAERVFFVD